jgi:hypothetical protein
MAAPSWLPVVAVAAVAPTVLGLCVHLAVGMGRPGQLGSGVTERTGSMTCAESEGVGENSSGTNPRSTSITEANSEVASDTISTLLDQGAGRRKLAGELNISENEARKLIDASRNGDGRV